MLNDPSRSQRKDPRNLSAKPATGVITVDLGQIARNWRALAAKVAPARCGAVVKANAYGLGAERVIPALANAGCTDFFVATADEAFDAKRLAPRSTVYVLDSLLGGNAAEAIHEAGGLPYDDVIAWASLAKRRGRPLPSALHIDTGLHRLGLAAKAVRALSQDAATLKPIAPQLIMSHLACADQTRHPKNKEQLVAFETLSSAFPGVRRSLAASDGLMLGPAYHFDLVRPGYALYGGQATDGLAAPVKPVVTVTAQILSVRDVAMNETVGYSASWRAMRPSRIATIAAGYADGVPRGGSATNTQAGGDVLIAGRRAPIVGRVSMDLITVDVTDLPDGVVRAGDAATLIGNGLAIEDAGYASGTIGYEILTRLGPRFQRFYLDDGIDSAG
jgi:alanine racemase